MNISIVKNIIKSQNKMGLIATSWKWYATIFFKASAKLPSSTVASACRIIDITPRYIDTSRHCDIYGNVAHLLMLVWLGILCCLHRDKWRYKRDSWRVWRVFRYGQYRDGLWLSLHRKLSGCALLKALIILWVAIDRNDSLMLEAMTA